MAGKRKGGSPLKGPGNRPSPKVSVGQRKVTVKGPNRMGTKMRMGKPGKRGQ